MDDYIFHAQIKKCSYVPEDTRYIEIFNYSVCTLPQAFLYQSHTSLTLTLNDWLSFLFVSCNEAAAALLEIALPPLVSIRLFSTQWRLMYPSTTAVAKQICLARLG